MNHLPAAVHRAPPVWSDASNERSTCAPMPAAPSASAAPGQSARRGMSVGQKLAASFAILGVAVALLGTTTWLTGQSTSRQAAILASEQLPIERAVHDWKTQSVHKIGRAHV